MWYYGCKSSETERFTFTDFFGFVLHFKQIGQETTFSQLSFTLYEILHNPRIEERYVA